MRLAAFIQQNMEPILQEWEDFARSIQPAHRTMDVAELRDHAAEMLQEIAEELERPGTAGKEREKQADGEDSPAEIHATLRLRSGFTIDQMAAEYRALRASVIHLWSSRSKTATWFEVEDIIRFNEALDRALSESVARYAAMERQAQDIFIGILGHDIRTPLSAISIAAGILMRTESLDGKAIQLASRIYDSSARISELVRDLLDFTHARFGMQLSPQPVNIGLLAEQVVEEIRSAWPERVIKLDMAGELAGTWDGGRISQVLSNLVNNALQHGSQTGQVCVSLAGTAEGVELKVHNLGEPIPADDFEHIFEPLRRLSRTPRDSRNTQFNLGLGLYIAREAVAAHGGTIEVKSSEQEGTTFAVRLPACAPSPALTAARW